MYVWLFKKMPNCFLSDCTIFYSHQQRVRVVVDAHLVLAIFFILAILTGVHVVVSHCGLICISWRLMRNTISWVCWTIILGPFLSSLIRYWVVIIFFILSTQVLGFTCYKYFSRSGLSVFSTVSFDEKVVLISMKSNVSIFLWLILSVSSLRSPCLPQIRVDFYVWVSDPLGANFCSLALGGSGVCFPWGYRVVEHRWSKRFSFPHWIALVLV